MPLALHLPAPNLCGAGEEAKARNSKATCPEPERDRADLNSVCYLVLPHLSLLPYVIDGGDGGADDGDGHTLITP